MKGKGEQQQKIFTLGLAGFCKPVSLHYGDGKIQTEKKQYTSVLFHLFCLHWLC